MLILVSRNRDPYWNLALEDYLLERIEDYGHALFLWQADHSVVVGKNQNPWRECRLDRLREDRGLLARRATGGGTVYHDMGNLNFAMLMRRADYVQADACMFVSAALGSLGLTVERMGKNSMGVGGRKVSGNAFCFRKNGALHHGTLLVQSNLERLQRYMGPSELEIRTRAVESVPAEVANLSEFAEGLTVKQVEDALVNKYAALRDIPPIPRDAREFDGPPLRNVHHRYVSWEWCFGQTPRFEIDLPVAFDWGQVVLKLTVDKGMIYNASVDAEGLDGADIGHIEGELLDCPFKANAMSRRIKNVIGRDGHALLEDLARWISERPLS